MQNIFSILNSLLQQTSNINLIIFAKMHEFVPFILLCSLYDHTDLREIKIIKKTFLEKE